MVSKMDGIRMINNQVKRTDGNVVLGPCIVIKEVIIMLTTRGSFQNDVL